MSELVEFKVPIKRYSQLIFVIGGGSIVLGILILSLLVFALLERDVQYLQEATGYFIVFPFFFMYAMWLVFGYEKVIIQNKNFELIKSNQIIKTRKIYPISEIKSVVTIEKSLKSNGWVDVWKEHIREKRRAFPFWIKMGQLKLITQNAEATFFNGLSSSESLLMKEIIENEIKKRKQNTP